MNYIVKYLGGTSDDPRVDTIEIQKLAGIETDAQVVRFVDFDNKTAAIIPLARLIIIYAEPS